VIAGLRLRVGDDLLAARPAVGAHAGSRVIVGIRPEDLEDAGLSGDGVPGDRRLPVTVELREAMGSETHLHCDLPGWSPPPSVLSVRSEPAEGSTRDGKRADLVARVSARSRAREGDLLELAVETSALHFFDPGSGLRL
jgi:multiple sugar transport system ATP-binding protein